MAQWQWLAAVVCSRLIGCEGEWREEGGMEAMDGWIESLSVCWCVLSVAVVVVVVACGVQRGKGPKENKRKAKRKGNRVDEAAEPRLVGFLLFPLFWLGRLASQFQTHAAAAASPSDHQPADMHT